MESAAHHFGGIELAMATCQCRRKEALTIRTLSSWLMPRVASLVAMHPELELDLQSSRALVDFERGPADVAIRYGKGHWPGVRSEHLSTNGSCRWLRPACCNICTARTRTT